MKAVLAFLIVAAMVTYSEAVTCYVCADCSEPSGEFDCGNDVTGCTKVDLNGVVGRSCGGTGKKGCTSVKLLGVKTTSCYCEGANCNSASTSAVSFLALLAPLIAAKLSS
ncbi:uncharacterized protein [Watersipora subatra]|uniref:uncharacterized protein n=1 Tax=Watersipora subatra TaxID=2589382 RepID=UPI00355AF84B